MKHICFNLTGKYVVNLNCWIADKHNNFNSPVYTAQADYFKSVIDAKMEIERCVHATLHTLYPLPDATKPTRVYVEYTIKGDNLYEQYTGFGYLFDEWFHFDNHIKNSIVKSKSLVLPSTQTQNVVSGKQSAFLRIPEQPRFRNDETGVPCICDDLQTVTFKIDGYNSIYDYDIKAPYSVYEFLHLKEEWFFLRSLPDKVQICYSDAKGVGNSRFVNIDSVDMNKMPTDPSAKQTAVSMPKVFSRFAIHITDFKLIKIDDIDEAKWSLLCIPENQRNDFVANIKKKANGDENPWVFFYQFDKVNILNL